MQENASVQSLFEIFPLMPHPVSTEDVSEDWESGTTFKPRSKRTTDHDILGINAGALKVLG